MSNIRYIITAPVRDEAGHLQWTIESVVSRTILPTKWILVNDGSTDEMNQMIEEAATGHNRIKTVHREACGARRAGDSWTPFTPTSSFSEKSGASVWSNWMTMLASVTQLDPNVRPESMERTADDI